jgi:hypothetical protein
MIIKPLGLEISINSQNSVSNAYAVRVVNPTSSNVLVTIASNSTTNSASFTVLGNSAIIVEKTPSYLIQGTGILATPVARKG